MPDVYDVIVVGAGSAGCALAARLSEDPKRSVLLIEAGQRFIGLNSYPPELRYGAFFAASAPGHPNNWDLVATLRPGMNQPLPRGKVVGGSSALNGTIFTRGIAEDFTDWVRAGNEAWSYDAVLPYFSKLERDLDIIGNHHGKDGPVPVHRVPRSEWSPTSTAFSAACEIAGFPHDADMNAPGSIGVGALPLNNIDGIRYNSALTYLDPIADRSNLRVLPETTVRRVLITGNRAIGIVAERGGEAIEIHGGEIVLSSGAIKSPHLLMTSGIGPVDELRSVRIPVVHEMPHVGRNFTDHCTLHVPLQVRDDRRMRVDPAKKPLSEVALHYTAPGSIDHSDMMLMPTLFSLAAAVLRNTTLRQRLRTLALTMRQLSWTKLVEQMTIPWDMTVMVILMRGRSRGEIRLTSDDSRTAPAVYYNYLEDPEDLRRLREGARLSARLITSVPYREIGARRTGYPDEILESDSLLDDYLRAHVSTSIHMASTCRMGSARENSVVDQRCRVHGISNLRVVDTSIMPTVVRRCPNATTMMIGERAAAFF